MVNFFDPDILYDDGSTYKSRKYREIIEEQVTISYIANSITLRDTDEISPHDRKIILNTIMKIKEAEKEAMEKSSEQQSV